MRAFFQTIFSILSALSVVAAFFMGVFWDMPFLFIGVAAALFFLVLTMFVKYGNPFRKDEDPHPDFMNSDEENARIHDSLERGEDEPDTKK